MILLKTLSLFLISANSCPPKAPAENLPLCPPGRMISENYPVKAVAISVFPNNRGRDTTDADQVILKIFEHSGENPPQILLSAYDRFYQQLVGQIQTMPGSPELKRKRINSIVRTIPGRAYWQQDFFESFIDPKSGQPVLRAVENYRYLGADLFGDFTKNLDRCEYAVGEALSAPTHHNGLEGGNIDTLPGGICVLGDRGFTTDVEWHAYADQFCDADRSKRIKAPTDWLSVGHADEIMKVIPNKNRSAPCDFSIVLSSPRLAIELLMANSQDRFVSLNMKNRNAARYITNRRYQDIPSLRNICDKAKEIRRQSVPQRTESQGISNLLQVTLFDIAVADDFFCANLTNGEVMNVMNQDENFKEYNYAVQGKINDFREDIKSKLKAALPQCEPDFLEVPDFFAPVAMETKMGKKVLPKASSVSILPNNTNSMSVNNLMLIADPSNDAFRRYVHAEYKARGLEVESFDMIDTFKAGRGSLHCLSHTIHHCRPRP